MNEGNIATAEKKERPICFLPTALRPIDLYSTWHLLNMFKLQEWRPNSKKPTLISRKIFILKTICVQLSKLSEENVFLEYTVLPTLHAKQQNSPDVGT